MAPTLHHAAPGPGRRGPAIATPPLDTSAAAKTNKRYSFTDTPMEMQAPRFNHPITSPTNSTIDESPITPASPSSRILPIYTEPETAHALVKEEKAHIQQQQQPGPPPPETHPAYFAPYREDTERQLQNPHQQRQQQQRPDAPRQNNAQPQVSITAPTPMSATSPPLPPPTQRQQQHQNGNSNCDTLKPQSAKQQSSQKPSSSRPTPVSAPPTAAAIVPDSFAPPPTISTQDISPSTHRPGQVSSSNTNTTHHWRHGLCDPSPLCCLSVILPCLVYGKTQYRLNRKFGHEDPTNLLGYEACNGACGLFALACGLQGILAALQRSRIRKVYGIEGDMATDCVKGICCCCCVVGQDEREMKEREEAKGGGAGGGVGAPTRAIMGAYVSPDSGMAYAPPPPR